MYEVSYKNGKIKKFHIVVRIKVKLDYGKLGREHKE